MGSFVNETDRSLAPVSVIIPCYRCADSIERALESIQRQTLLPTEVLFVEDASADGGKTLEKLRELVSKHRGSMRLQILCMDKNGGPGEARNFGWAHVSQPYIAFLDADDAWHRQKIEIQYTWMKTHPEAALSCHETIVLPDVKREPLLLTTSVDARPISACRMLFSNAIPTRTVMIRSSIANRFPKGERYAEDYQLWLQIIFTDSHAYRIRLPMAFSFKSDYGVSGISKNMCEMHRGEWIAYNRLLEEGYIAYPTFIFVVFFARIKFWCRQIFVAFGRMPSKWKRAFLLKRFDR